MIRLAAPAALTILAGCVGHRAFTAIELDAASAEELRAAYEATFRVAFPEPSWGSYPDRYRYRAALRSEYAERVQWDPATTSIVETGHVERGMTADQLFWAWGPPIATEATTSPHGRSERWEWSYDDNMRRRSATIVDGVVAWWRIDE